MPDPYLDEIAVLRPRLLGDARSGEGTSRKRLSRNCSKKRDPRREILARSSGAGIRSSNTEGQGAIHVLYGQPGHCIEMNFGRLVYLIERLTVAYRILSASVVPADRHAVGLADAAVLAPGRHLRPA
jgi:hypothetical protein